MKCDSVSEEGCCIWNNNNNNNKKNGNGRNIMRERPLFILYTGFQYEVDAALVYNIGGVARRTRTQLII